MHNDIECQKSPLSEIGLGDDRVCWLPSPLAIGIFLDKIWDLSAKTGREQQK